jgi:hypothetical protein
MARTAIVTSHPEVTCEICARRLLRGEQPDTFLADGEPALVCVLCSDRALQAGWMRAAEPAAGPPRVRAHHRRSGSLREFLRRWRAGEQHERSTRPRPRGRRPDGAAAESSQG